MLLRPVAYVTFLLVTLLGGCVQYKPVDVFVIGMQPAAGSAMEQRVRIELRIQNPNDQPIEAHGMQVRLDVNGARLARGVSDAAFTIPRLGETTTSIVATTSLFDIAKQIVVLSGTQSFKYVLEGDVFVDSVPGGFGRSVSFHNEGEFKPGAPVNQTGAGALH